MRNSVPNASNVIAKKFYYIENRKIIHIYDPPHLIKGIRNNLLTKNLVWNSNQGPLTAKWEDILNAYEVDNCTGEIRAMTKITDQHLIPNKIKKMKVSYAAQVLSHSVASAVKLLSYTGLKSATGVQVDRSAVETGKILHFFDQLFDSVNGHALYPRNGKKFKCAMSATSGHLKFFRVAKQALQSMHFIEEKTKKTIRPPSLTNWIVTINGLIDLFYLLTKIDGVSFIKPRVFNQDPLANFFGQIRQRGIRNTNPTATMFNTHFKTMLINNFATRHSISANCEEDSSQILKSVNNYISSVGRKRMGPTEPNLTKNIVINDSIFSKLDTYSITYVAGYFSKNIKTLYSCDICKKNILCQNVEEWHD